MNTKDMNYAAYLLANNQKLEKCYPDGRKFWFVFPDRGEIKPLTQAYYLNTGMIKPQDFIHAQKILKNLVRNFQLA
jgi:hypothetical protein